MLDELSTQIVLQALKEPETARVLAISDQDYNEVIAHNESTAPQYLVYPISWDDVEPSALGVNLVTSKACIIDSGESFDVSNPPKDLGIPQVS